MSGWRTYPLPPPRAFAAWKRCLWCGARGHWREDCAGVHAHGVVQRGGNCLGCGQPATERAAA